MKKIMIPIFSLLIFSCSKDSTNDSNDLDNNNPEFTANQSFSIEEHSAFESSIGIIKATDKDNDALTYTIQSEADLIINENTGEITIGENTILDFETTPSISATISVFDGTTIVDEDIIITLENIEEYAILTAEQKELVDYFRYLTLWEDSNALSSIQKWGAPMKIFLDGAISTDYKATVQSVLDQYNALFNLGTFSITIVETKTESNVHLYYGNAEEIETLWPDMHEIIEGKTYDGYAISSGTGLALNNSRIWISSPIESLLKHELGHSLGLGHSNKCDEEKSFLCSTISPNNDFLDVEKEIIRFLYHKDMVPGTTAEELNNAVGNLILLN
ncbi:DUF2927 domain-containing protein [uncultured Maribacter sp.]|uniref:DUF2927 domain-containing protein n=1 Tax=uncultured Maribacter sp. TaxID=431308 RepID=UPI0026063B7D|nr:DUF2927 domain-containing protein [uncultured Maribacter sp.]